MSINSDDPYRNFAVLVVDDDSVHRLIVRRTLQRELSLTVHEANDGRTALQMLKNLIPDLVLLDLSMKDIDGDAVLNRLRYDQATRDIPVIMCTAENQPEMIKRLMAMHIDGYIVKPYTTELLVDKVKAVFDRHLK